MPIGKGLSIRLVDYWISERSRKKKGKKKKFSHPVLPSKLWQQLLRHLTSVECFVQHSRLRMFPLYWEVKVNWSCMVDKLELPLLPQAFMDLPWNKSQASGMCLSSLDLMV